MAPQLVRKQKYTYKCDVWSIGVILFVLLEKESPFHCETVPQLQSLIEKGKYKLNENTIDKITVECI